MSANKQIILLDTMVVAGIFAVSKNGGDWLSENKQQWSDAILSLSKSIKATGCEFLVPTSVCYELMTMNKDWKKLVLSESDSVFRYAKRAISNEILQLAAEYSFNSCSVGSDDTKHKVKSFDPVTAAYSLKHGYPIITENQKDFTEPFFSITEIKPVVVNIKKGKERRLLCLISPNKNI